MTTPTEAVKDKPLTSREAYEKWQDAPETKWPEFSPITADLVWEAWQAATTHEASRLAGVLEGVISALKPFAPGSVIPASPDEDQVFLTTKQYSDLCGAYCELKKIRGRMG